MGKVSLSTFFFASSAPFFYAFFSLLRFILLLYSSLYPCFLLICPTSLSSFLFSSLPLSIKCSQNLTESCCWLPSKKIKTSSSFLKSHTFSPSTLAQKFAKPPEKTAIFNVNPLFLHSFPKKSSSSLRYFPYCVRRSHKPVRSQPYCVGRHPYCNDAQAVSISPYLLRLSQFTPFSNEEK